MALRIHGLRIVTLALSLVAIAASAHFGHPTAHAEPAQPQVAYGWGYGSNSFTASQRTNGSEAEYFSVFTTRSPINIQSLDQGIPSTLSGTLTATGGPNESWVYPDIRTGEVKLVLNQPVERTLVPATVGRHPLLTDGHYGIVGPNYDQMSWFEAKPEIDGLHVRMDTRGTATKPSDRMVDIVVPKGRALELNLTQIIPSSRLEPLTITLWYDGTDWVGTYSRVLFDNYEALWTNHLRNLVIVNMANRVTIVVTD